MEKINLFGLMGAGIALLLMTVQIVVDIIVEIIRFVLELILGILFGIVVVIVLLALFSFGHIHYYMTGQTTTVWRFLLLLIKKHSERKQK